MPNYIGGRYMNESGANGSERGTVCVRLDIKESIHDTISRKAREHKITNRALLVEIIESWVSDIRMKERLKEEKESKKIYTETPDPEPEEEEEE